MNDMWTSWILLQLFSMHLITDFPNICKKWSLSYSLHYNFTITQELIHILFLHPRMQSNNNNSNHFFFKYLENQLLHIQKKSCSTSTNTFQILDSLCEYIWKYTRKNSWRKLQNPLKKKKKKKKPYLKEEYTLDYSSVRNFTNVNGVDVVTGMLSTDVGANVGHVFRSVNTIGAVESWHLATLELGVIIKIVLVTEDARARRAWELLLLAVCGHGRFLKICTPSSDGGGRVAEICHWLETHWNRNDTTLRSDDIVHVWSIKFSTRFLHPVLSTQFSRCEGKRGIPFYTFGSFVVEPAIDRRSSKGRQGLDEILIHTRRVIESSLEVRLF